MPYIPDSSLDLALNDIQDNVETLHICNAEPTTYAEATSTYSIGNKASPTVAEPSDRSPNGRECVVSAITDGTVTSEDVPTHIALVKDSATSRLLLVAEISNSQTVYVANPFTLPQWAFGFPDAVNDT